MTHLTTQPIALEPLLQSDGHADGAVLLFTGTVREQNEGRPVHGMTYTAHEPIAEQVLAQICQRAEADFAISRCRIVHRLGELTLGEISVAIAVHSPHRDQAYAASRWAIEELKRSTPIFKQEHYVDGDSRYLDGNTLNEAL